MYVRTYVCRYARQYVCMCVFMHVFIIYEFMCVCVLYVYEFVVKIE
jgi:hypothetical protein